MEIWHHVGFSKNDNVDEELKSLHVEYKVTPSDVLGNSYLITFDISETDQRWPQVNAIAQLKNGFNSTDTVFSEQEIRAAEWSRLAPRHSLGYPQPMGTWVTTQPNYNSFCRKCGADFVQVTPFRISKEPGMKRCDFTSLLWTHTLFAAPHALELFESANVRGYEIWDALVGKARGPAQAIRQVYIPGVTAQGLLDSENLRPTVCPQCGLTKYDYHKRGYMSYWRDALPADVDIMQSYEWFGSGADAYHEIFVSNKVTALILDRKLKGVSFKPLALC